MLRKDVEYFNEMPFKTIEKQRKMPLLAVPGALLAALGVLLAALGALLGGFWPLLAALGGSWAALGPLLGGSWAALGPLLGALGPLLAALGRSWAALGTTCKNHGKIDAKMTPFGLPKGGQNGAKIDPKTDQNRRQKSMRKRIDIRPS